MGELGGVYSANIFSPPELLVIMLIALVVFGAGKLPEAGKSLGRAIKEFKGAIEGRPEEAAPSVAPSTAVGVEIACPGCAKGNAGDAVFCRHCGHRMSAPEFPRA